MLVTIELKDTDEVKALVKECERTYRNSLRGDNFEEEYEEWLDATLELENYILNAVKTCHELSADLHKTIEEISEASGVVAMSVEFEQKEVYAL